MLNPLTLRLGGANLDRQTLDHLPQAGFQIDSVESLAWGIVKLVRATPCPPRRASDARAREG